MTQQTIAARAKRRTLYTGESYAQVLQEIRRKSPENRIFLPDAHSDVQRYLESLVALEVLELNRSIDSTSNSPFVIQRVRPFDYGIELTITEEHLARFCSSTTFANLLATEATYPGLVGRFSVQRKPRGVEVIHRELQARVIIRGASMEHFRSAIDGRSARHSGVPPLNPWRCRAFSALLRRWMVIRTGEELLWVYDWCQWALSDQSAESSFSRLAPNSIQVLLEDPHFGWSLTRLLTPERFESVGDVTGEALATRRTPFAFKVLVAGGFGVGKSTLVGALSEIRPLHTEEVLTYAGIGTDDLVGVEDKRTTTVAMDFGRITINEDLKVYLFGTPGQDRFWFLWDELAYGALGAVVLADTRRLADSFPSVDYFERHGIPFVVGVNCFEGGRRYTSDAVRQALDLDPDVPIVLCDVRERQSGELLLIALAERIGAVVGEHTGVL